MNQLQSIIETDLRKGPKLNLKKGLIILTIALLVLSTLSIIGISTYVGWSLTHPDRKPVDDSPENYDLAYEDVSFKSKKGDVQLKGWWLSAEQNLAQPNGKTVVLAHGYSENRLQKQVPGLSLASLLTSNGYNVLLFDFRNSGVSEGTLTTVGQYEKMDLLGAIDYVKSIQSDTKIILFGFSMGASTSLITAAASPDVSAVIADSPFDDLRPYLEANLPVWSDLPHFPFTPMILTIIPIITGMDPDQVRPIEDIALFGQKPILLIHGDSDHSIPMSNSERILAKANNANAKLWIVPGADHVKARSVNPAAYDQKVLEFLTQVD
jgi:fermentation-respiration switch protein FrsA (DUF1100 family)